MSVRRPARSTCAIALPLLAALGGCAPVDEDVVMIATASVQQAIEGGYLDDFDKPVVFIAHVSGAGYAGCTGSLIAANTVLTAQHCVAPVLNQVSGGVVCGTTTFGNPYPADDLWVTTDTTSSYNPQAYIRAAEVHIPPGGPAFCGRDQAILILQQPMAPEVALPLVPRVDDVLIAGEEYSAIGYGQLYDSPSAPSGTRYRRDGLRVDCVDAACPNYAVDPPEWVGEDGVCSGDSGGPAMDLLWRVAGVASRGSAGCGNPVYGNVQGLGAWIQEITRYAVGLMGAEPPPWATGWPTDPAYSHPVGGPCDLPEHCPSGICIGDYCSRLCDERAPCPEGFECAPDSGLCIQSAPPVPEPGILPAPDPRRSVDDAEGSCAIRPGATRDDPTKPIPWGIGLAALIGLGLLRRRPRRR